MRGKRDKKPKANNNSASTTNPKESCKGCANKESHINWICCDICKRWWHCVCASIRVNDAAKMKRHKIRYTCANCVLDRFAPKVQLEVTKILQHTPHEHISNQNDLLPSTQPVSDTTDSTTTKDSSNVPDSTNVDKPESLSSNILHDSSNESCSTSTKGDILIIDGLQNPQNFTDSSVIKKEIKKHKNLNIKFTYQLSRGGIVIHTHSDEENKLLKASWPKEAFEDSGDSLKVHEIKSKYRCVLKNIPIGVSEIEIKNEVECVIDIDEEVFVRRLKYKDSGKPLRIVIVECGSQKGLHTLLNAKLRFRNSTTVVSIYTSKQRVPTRCYNCQEFSHIAKLCKNKTVCENCGEEHIGKCEKEVKCHNCKGSHKASSRFCPVFLNLLDRLSSRE